MYFKYSNKEINYLKKKDQLLGAAIERIGKIDREVTKDPFEGLIGSIISQQISKKAAKTVWNRFAELITKITPENIIKANDEDIQKCGMTNRKVYYIKEIATAAIKGEIDFTKLNTLSDQEIINKLTKLHGVGVWTAEMLLIFSLNRPDIVSYNDLAIRRGMMNLYGLKTLTKEQFQQYKNRYSPYGSVASLYLWELSH
ncbi:DNA-3-methyladenine glycosylase 2 family protein [Mycoplasmatota bacterium]|nr:DNA-3-methyladenine glycosylase 2 family protein [Mycoplasmatota bacterium]